MRQTFIDIFHSLAVSRLFPVSNFCKSQTLPKTGDYDLPPFLVVLISWIGVVLLPSLKTEAMADLLSDKALKVSRFFMAKPMF
jgi:hypothetical protein